MGKDLEHPTEMHALSQTIFVGASVKEKPQSRLAHQIALFNGIIRKNPVVVEKIYFDS